MAKDKNIKDQKQSNNNVVDFNTIKQAYINKHYPSGNLPKRQNSASKGLVVAPGDYKNIFEVKKHLLHMLQMHAPDSDVEVSVNPSGTISGSYCGYEFDLSYVPNKSAYLTVRPMPYNKQEQAVVLDIVDAITPLMWSRNPNAKNKNVSSGPLLKYNCYNECLGYDELDAIFGNSETNYVWEIYDPDRVVREHCFKYIVGLENMQDLVILQHDEFFNDKLFETRFYKFGEVEFFFSEPFVDRIKNMSQSELFLRIKFLKLYLDKAIEQSTHYYIIGSDSKDAKTAAMTVGKISFCLAWLWQQTRRFGLKCNRPNSEDIPELTKSQEKWITDMEGVYSDVNDRLGLAITCQLTDLEGDTEQVTAIHEPADDVSPEVLFNIYNRERFYLYLEAVRITNGVNLTERDQENMQNK